MQHCPLCRECILLRPYQNLPHARIPQLAHHHMRSCLVTITMIRSVARAIHAARAHESRPHDAALQVGASNELPESEELDALYDRFLIRRQVAQVSSAQLPTLARLAAGNPLPAAAPPPSEGNSASAALADPDQLLMDDFRCTPAYRTLEGGTAVDVLQLS